MKLHIKCLLAVLLPVIFHQVCFGLTWTETTQEDFADGIFERNLYASQRNGGSVEFVARFDLDHNGYIDLFTADISGPSIRIYWGTDNGYSPANATLFSTNGATNCDAADFNFDGYPELFVAHRAEPLLSIYLGTPSGPDPNNHIDFTGMESCRDAVFVADCNKDGFLDMVPTQEFTTDYSAVFWGDSAGFDLSNRTDLPLGEGARNIEVADFNKDTWLDILYVQYLGSGPGESRIFWGDSVGFTPGNYTSLIAPYGNVGSSTADLNRDGYLDLIFTGWYDTHSYIYWGSGSGYSGANMQTLNPGYSYGGSAVADINRDGFLDIVYHRGGYGEHRQGIYWGSASGYSDQDTSWIGIPIEATGGFIADFNYDGHLDIFCNVITPGNQSFLFWGPDYTTYTSLPVNNDHHGMFREIGNVYTREYEEEYFSSIFDAGEFVEWQTITWEDSLPRVNEVLFAIRTGNTPSPDSSWSFWLPILKDSIIPDSLASQYIQYKTAFRYVSPAYLPYLWEVRIDYEPYVDVIEKHEGHGQPSLMPMLSFLSSNMEQPITMKLALPRDAIVTASLIDCTGRKIAAIMDKERKAKGTYAIELGDLLKGISTRHIFMRATIAEPSGKTYQLSEKILLLR